MKTIPVILAVLSALLFASSTPSYAGTTINFGSINEVTGPASLDLAGNIVYAVTFDGPSQTVNGVEFVADATPPAGFTSYGPNNVPGGWQTKPEFGSSPDEDALENVYKDIRWTQNGVNDPLQANMTVTAGLQYRLQVLFYGNHDEFRGWDIRVENVDAVDNITSTGVDTGAGPPAWSPNRGLVFSYDFTAPDNEVNVYFGQMFGAGVEGTDGNAIWQGITLERLTAPSDSDGDSLPDEWEMLYFNNLTQNGTGDPDADGLTNSAELTAQTLPNDADTDNDGLNDGPEVNTHFTNPRSTDSDTDGLTDGFEVNTLLTNPADPDTDNDDYTDGAEAAAFTNATNPNSFPLYAPAVGRFSGGDQDEGLDLDGTIFRAVRFVVSGTTGSWPVRDATFVPHDTVAGLTQDAVNEIAQWVTAAFPSPTTANDTNLTEVVRSIRYNGVVFNVTVSGLTVGRSYKVQLLFAEACCNNRGFDVYVEDKLVADEFSPGLAQGGATATPSRGAVVSAGFLATDDTLNVRLDFSTITTAGLTDSNAILNALTIEENPNGPDSDGDTLPDAWEMYFFTNLDQTAGGDPDSDGLTNIQELLAVTQANDPDTDNDNLNDGPELNTHLTNPRNADTDADGLNDGAEIAAGANPNDTDSDDDTLTDGAEVNTHSSNPTRIDSDNDGYNDPTEVMNSSNPASATSFPPLTFVSRVLGGDPGEGLDLTGNFRYAFNVGTPGAPVPGQARDANFTGDFEAGITVSAPNEIGLWNDPQFGPSAADAVLNFVYQSIRWADAGNAIPEMRNIKVDLAGVTPGRQYKLQLLIGEQCCPSRFFDVSVEGAMIVDEFHTAAAQGSFPVVRAGSAIVHTFTAGDDTVNILLDGLTATGGADHNAILNGVTLEDIGTTASFEITSVTRTPTKLTLNAKGVPSHAYSVDFSTNLTTWAEVTDSLVPNAQGNATFEDTNLSRVDAARGFYRLRDP